MTEISTIRQKVKLRTGDNIIYQVVLSHAQKGMVCPTNESMLDHVNYTTGAEVSMGIRRLEDAGLVTVTRNGKKRIVHFPKEGVSTATPPNMDVPVKKTISTTPVNVNKIYKRDGWAISRAEVRYKGELITRTKRQCAVLCVIVQKKDLITATDVVAALDDMMTNSVVTSVLKEFENTLRKKGISITPVKIIPRVGIKWEIDLLSTTWRL